MNVDIVKTSSTQSTMDTMSMMMMHIENFPELLSEPFYNTTTTVPILNVPPPANDVINFPVMTSSSSPPLQQNNNITSSSGRYRMNHSNNNNNNNCSSSFAAMREMIFRIAVMQPIQIDAEAIKAPKRRNVKISKDPQSVAARHRRERISERIRILQRLVPGGTKMDTASMLDEAVHYVKFLKKQLQRLEQAGANNNTPIGGSLGMSSANVVNYSAFLMKGCAQQPYHMLGSSSNQQLLS